jgi:hypothetical protein
MTLLYIWLARILFSLLTFYAIYNITEQIYSKIKKRQKQQLLRLLPRHLPLKTPKFHLNSDVFLQPREHICLARGQQQQGTEGFFLAFALLSLILASAHPVSILIY